jgi:hypothetical protein
MLPLAAASLALAAAGGVSSLIRGGIQGKKAKGLRSEYDSYEKSIPMQDPNQVAFLGDVRRRRRSFDAGTDPLTQFTAQQARNMGAQTQANMVRGGIGNVNNLLRSQKRHEQGPWFGRGRRFAEVRFSVCHGGAAC